MVRNQERDFKKANSGFSLIELTIILCIVGFCISISGSVFSAWIPDYRLRTRAKELYSDMYFAKMKAIKENSNCKIIFMTGETESYSIQNADGNIDKTVVFSSSESNHKIGFGCGSATKSAVKSGGAPPDDGISYTSNTVSFNFRGTGKSGYVYIDNSKGSSYAIGSLSSGVIFLKKWDKSSGSWK